MRGKAIVEQNRPLRRIGSPPRMRGKGTARTIRNTASGRDHPRVCGEKVRVMVPKRCRATGSPPRVRGKGCSFVACMRTCTGITPACAGKRASPCTSENANTGITPACAGKRPSNAKERLLCRKGSPPRVRGKGPCTACSTSVVQGSPPRVRGKACSALRVTPSSIGITPACAGKSCQVHQRVENT